MQPVHAKTEGAIFHTTDSKTPGQECRFANFRAQIVNWSCRVQELVHEVASNQLDDGM